MDAHFTPLRRDLVCEALVEVGLFKKRVVSGNLACGLFLRLVDRSRASKVLADLIVESLASKTIPRPFLATDSALLASVAGRVHDVWSR